MANAFDQLDSPEPAGVVPAATPKTVNPFDSLADKPVQLNPFDDMAEAPAKPNPFDSLADKPAEDKIPWWKNIIMSPSEWEQRQAAGTLPASQQPIDTSMPRDMGDVREQAAKIVETLPMAAGAAATLVTKNPSTLAAVTGATAGVAHETANWIRGKPPTPMETAANAAIWSLVPGLPAGEVAVSPMFAIRNPVMTAVAKVAPKALVAGGEGISLSALYQYGTTGQIDWNKAFRTGGFTGVLGLTSGLISAYDANNASMVQRQNLIDFARNNWGASFKGTSWEDLRNWTNDQMAQQAKVATPAPAEAAGAAKPALPEPVPTLEAGKAAATPPAVTELDALNKSAESARITQELAQQKEMDYYEGASARLDLIKKQKAAELQAEIDQTKQQGELLRLQQAVSKTTTQQALDAAKVAKATGTTPVQQTPVGVAGQPETPVNKAAEILDQQKTPPSMANIAAAAGKAATQNPEALPQILLPLTTAPAQAAPAAPGIAAAPVAPATPALPQITAEFKPAEVLQQLDAASPAEVLQQYAALKDKGGFGALAVQLGTAMRGRAEVDQLPVLQQQAEEALRAAAKANDETGIMANAMKAQFWREAHETAMGTSALANRIEKEQKNAPLPQVVKDANKALVQQASSSEVISPVVPKTSRPVKRTEPTLPAGFVQPIPKDEINRLVALQVEAEQQLNMVKELGGTAEQIRKAKRQVEDAEDAQIAARHKNQTALGVFQGMQSARPAAGRATAATRKPAAAQAIPESTKAALRSGDFMSAGNFFKGPFPTLAILDSNGLQMVPDMATLRVLGGHITTPHASYGAAMEAGVRGDVYVNQSPSIPNANKVLLVQFTSRLLQPAQADKTAALYYDKLYEKRAPAGYYRMADTWEVPQWQAELTRSLGANADLYIVRDMEQAKKFFAASGYGHVAFSVLDVNKDKVGELAASIPGKIVLGGYTDTTAITSTNPRATRYDTLPQFLKTLGVPYVPGFDYRLYGGANVIARLQLSAGCAYRVKCGFCTIPREITMASPAAVEQQLGAFADLNGHLIYLNDKTFGQAANYTMLPKLAERMRRLNPGFKGFIVQTSTAALKHFSDEYLQQSGIAFVELGIESYNDPILKDMKKPSSEKLSDQAAEILRRNHIAMIPNIMIGLPKETAETYARTLAWLEQNKDIISHVNIYNTAVYPGTALAAKIKSNSPLDADENSVVKSFHTDPAVHQAFAKALYAFASGQLDKPVNIKPLIGGPTHAITQPSESSIFSGIIRRGGNGEGGRPLLEQVGRSVSEKNTSSEIKDRNDRFTPAGTGAQNVGRENQRPVQASTIPLAERKALLGMGRGQPSLGQITGGGHAAISIPETKSTIATSVEKIGDTGDYLHAISKQKSDALPVLTGAENRSPLGGQIRNIEEPAGARKPPQISDQGAQVSPGPEGLKALRASVELALPDASPAIISRMAVAVQKRSSDIGRIVQLMGDKLYSAATSKTTGKELVQNAIDAVMKNPEDNRLITVSYWPINRNTSEKPQDEFVLSDNGLGMTPDVIVDKLLPAGVSGKDIGEAGGLGLGKIAIFGGNREWLVVSIARDAEDRLVKSTLRGTGVGYYKYISNPPMVTMEPDKDIPISDGITLRYTYIPDGHTGTAVRINTMDGWEAEAFVKKAAIYQPTIKLYALASEGAPNSASNTPLGSIGAQLAGLAMTKQPVPFRLMNSVDTKASTVDFIVPPDATMSKGRFFFIDVLNRGILQFPLEVSVPSEISIPNGMAINIKPKVRAEDKDYPFTTNREDLVESASGPINAWIKEAGEREAERQNALYANVIHTSVPLEHNPGLVFLDAGQTVKPELMRQIASDKMVMDVTNEVATIQDRVLSFLKRRYPAEGFGRAKFQGLLTGGNAFAVHFGKKAPAPSFIYHDIFRTWEKALVEAAASIDSGEIDGLSRNISERTYQYFITKIIGISLHEALHQIVSEEGESLARQLTFKAGEIRDLVLTLTEHNYSTSYYEAIDNALQNYRNELQKNEDTEKASTFIVSQGGYHGYALADREPSGEGVAGSPAQPAGPSQKPAAGLPQIAGPAQPRNVMARLAALDARGPIPASTAATKAAGVPQIAAGAPPGAPPPPKAPPAAPAAPRPPRRPGQGQISLLNPAAPGAAAARLAQRGVVGQFDPNQYVAGQVARQATARGKDSPTTLYAKGVAAYYTLKREFVDFLAPIEDYVRKAQRQHGYEILNTQYPGYNTNITEQFDRALNTHTIASAWVQKSDFVKIIQEVPNLDVLGQYLIARHNETLAAMGIEKGRNRAADQNLIASLYKTYEPLAKRFTNFSQLLLQKAVEYGLFPADKAAELVEMYPDYVPTNTIFSEIEQNAISQGGSRSVASLSTQTVVRRIEGSKREVENPLASIMRTVAAVFSEGERNRAAEMVASMRTLPGFTEIIREIRPGENAPKHSISYLDGGHRRTFEVPQEFEQAAKQLGAVTLHLITRIMAAPIRIVKAGITGLYPAFALRNLPKDQIAAFTNSKWGVATSIFNPDVFLRALYEAVGHGKIYDFMSEHGAMFTGFDPLRNPTVKSLEAIRAQRTLWSGLRYTLTHPKEWLRTAEDIVGRTEQQTRMQQFIGTVRQEMRVNHRSVEDAVLIGLQEARTNTANFPRHGELSRAITLFQIFFNPRIQGSRADIRGLARNPGKASWKIPVGIFKLVSSMLLPVALMTLWNMMDEKRRRAYLDISQTERENNFIIVPSNPQKDSRNKWIVAKLPLPQGFNSLTWPVRRMIESHFTLDPVKATEVASAILNFVSPLEMTKSGLSTAAVPQPVKPIVEGLFNQDSFTGAPIVPERLLKFSPTEQYDERTTSGSMVALARLINNASNGSLAFSPMVLEHDWRGWTGGLGADALNALDTTIKTLIEKTAPNQPVVWGTSTRDLWTSMIGSFTTATGGQQLRTFYDNLKTSSSAYNDWQKAAQSGNVTKAAEIMAAHDGDFGLTKLMSSYGVRISKTYQTIRLLQHSELTQTEKQKVPTDQQIATLQAMILDTAESANRIYHDAQKPRK